MTVSRRAWIVPDNPYAFPPSLAVRCGCRAYLDDVQDVQVSWSTRMCGNDCIYSVSCKRPLVLMRNQNLPIMLNDLVFGTLI